MANNRNFLELLINLGISEDSEKNINEYIKKLKTDKVKIELEVDGTSSVNKDFSATTKIIEDLQEQVKQLKGELKGLGKGSSIGVDGIEDFKKEIGQSIKSIGDLEKRVKDFNGTISLTYGNVKMPNGIEEKVLKSINANMTDIDGTIKNLTFKPLMDSNGFITGINEVIEKVKKVDFKDFDAKAEKTSQLIKELGRQGNLSANDLSDFESRLENLKVNKSVSDLEKLNTELREMNKELSHDAKMDNSMVNVNKQAQDLAKTLDKLNNVDGLNKLQISQYVNELERLSSVDIKTNSQLKEVNSDFKSVEDGIKSLVKEANRLSKVDVEIEKLQTTIAKLQNQGSLSKAQANKFLLDIKDVEKTTEAVKKLENQINKTANATTSDNKIKNAMGSISPTVDRLNEKLDIMVNKLGSNVDTSRLEKIRNEIQQIGNTKLTTIDEIGKLNVQLSQTEKSITQLGVASNATSKYEDSIRKANKLLDDLEQSGYGVSSSIDEFRKKLSNIPTNDLSQVKNLVNDIEKDIKEAGNQRAVVRLLDEMEEKAHLLEAKMERTKNLFKRTFDHTEAQATANVIAKLREEIDKIRANPVQATTKAMDELRNSARQANTEVADFHANSTTAARNSMGVIESLKVAMEKFPVWMMASTAFYSTIRGITDLTQKVLELDQAMTNLIRVANGDQFEFDQVIERANENVTALSGNMKDYLDLVTEFARTGKTINESFDLADTTQTLLNVSELDAKESVDALTASMISFNISAEDSIRIADRLNEVDNNFSVTTKILSDGIAKASATASTFGVTIDELIGNITSISAQTRESGSIVGNSLKTLYARISTNSSALKALREMNIAMEDSEGKAKSSSQLLGEVAQKWGTLGEQQKRTAAVQIAGIYQLSRLKFKPLAIVILH